ncbi:MAG: sortase [Lachnospiraceae bacterium]|nr:sortase [Lachnospiraceae bacterium]
MKIGKRVKAKADPQTPQTDREKRRKRKKILRKVGYLVPVALFAMFIIFGILFIRDYREYKIAKDAYKELDSLVQEKGMATAKSLPMAVRTSDDEEDDEFVVTEPEVTFEYPDLEIDFPALKQVNPDFVGVLYVPALEMRYPVVRSKDNEDYLHKTFDGITNSAGAIFLDYLGNPDMEDKNTFLFGHNMRNGSMFGSLKKFTQDDTLAAKDPYVYFYTSDCVRKYEIFSYYFSFVGSDAYQNFTGDDGYDAYVKKSRENSLFVNDDVDFTNRPNILSLTTCSGTEHVRRLLVQSALIGKAAY